MEIKVRAWDNVNKRMGYFKPGFSWLDEYDIWCLMDADDDRSKSITDVPCNDNIDLTLFTGLKDKKGNDVYHKDYLKSGKKIFVVEWQKEEARFFLAPTIGNPDNWKFMDEVDHMEVCGNVFQNAELVTR